MALSFFLQLRGYAKTRISVYTIQVIVFKNFIKTLLFETIVNLSFLRPRTGRSGIMESLYTKKFNNPSYNKSFLKKKKKKLIQQPTSSLKLKKYPHILTL